MQFGYPILTYMHLSVLGHRGWSLPHSQTSFSFLWSLALHARLQSLALTFVSLFVTENPSACEAGGVELGKGWTLTFLLKMPRHL